GAGGEAGHRPRAGHRPDDPAAAPAGRRPAGAGLRPGRVEPAGDRDRRRLLRLPAPGGGPAGGGGRGRDRARGRAGPDVNRGPGDMVVVLTDGFYEWANGSRERFGSERMGEAIRAVSGLAAEDVIREAYRAVTGFAAGTAQNDDLTAVVVKRR